jgi:hypothetical protein
VGIEKDFQASSPRNAGATSSGSSSKSG